MAQFLTDLIPYSGDRDTLLYWANFSNPVIASLQVMFARLYEDDSWREGICYKHLEGLQISDLTDTRFVGERRKTQILEELYRVFAALEADGDVLVVVPKIVLEEILIQDDIDIAKDFEGLISAILAVYDDYRSIDERTLSILRGRIPCFITIHRTLENLGFEYSVSRERIRQIEIEYLDLQLEPCKEDNVLLRTIVESLEQCEDANAFYAMLTEADLIGKEPITVAKLKAVLEFLGLKSFIARVESVENIWHSGMEEKDALSVLAPKYRDKFGLIDLALFTSETKTTETLAIEAINSKYPRSIRMGKLVLARTQKLDTAFENVIGKQLMVFGNLEPEDLLVGIERHASYRQVSISGCLEDQIALIREIAGENPNYETYRDHTIEEPELSPTDIWFLEVFRDSPTGLMHRNDLTAAAIRDGKNLSSVSVFALFNPLIRSAGAAMMALANVNVDPDFVRRYASIARAEEGKTRLDFEFRGSNILLNIIPNLNTMIAGVLFPLPDLQTMIQNALFEVSCECGELKSDQQLRLRPPNFWTGFTATIRHAMDKHHFEKGEELQILLDFDKSVAQLVNLH